VTEPAPLASTGSQQLHQVRWSALAIVGRQGLQLVALAILARVLVPEDFGLMAMAMVVVGFAMLFRDMGLAASVIQKSKISGAYLSAQFWLVLSISTVASVLLFVTAPLLAELYQEPEMTNVVRLAAPILALSGVGAVPQALLERRLEFRLIARIEVGAATVGLVIAVAVALAGGGVYSLVAQALAVATVGSVAFMATSGWRPQITFGASAARTGVSFGAPVTTFNAANFATRNADYFLIGRVLGPVQLGYYALAYRIMLIPVQLVSGAFNRVLFPSLAQEQDDPVRIRSIYLEAVGAVGLLAFPIGIVTAVTAHRLVPVLFGPGWEEAVPVLSVLALVGIGQSIGATVGPIWMASGHVREMAVFGVIGGAVVVTGFVLTVSSGLLAVAVGYLVTSTVALLVPSMMLAYRHIELRIIDVGRTLSRDVLVAALVGALVAAAAIAISDWPDLPALLVLIATAGISTLLLSVIFNRRGLEQALQLVSAGRRPASSFDAAPGGWEEDA
jgi:PST family polysaccharide transporter